MNATTDVIALSKENFEAAKAIAENFKEVQTKKMRELLESIRNHLIQNIKKQSNITFDFDQYVSSTEKFYLGKTDYIQLKFKLGLTYDDISLKLIFEILKKGNERFYYGVVPEFKDFFTNGKYDGTKHLNLIQQNKNALKSIFNNESWNKCIDTMPKNSFWVWKRYLPSKYEQPDFIECDDNYLKLYDSADYDQFLKKIYSELDNNMQSILEKGIPST